MRRFRAETPNGGGGSLLWITVALVFVSAVLALGVTGFRGGATPALAVTDTDGDGWSDSAEATIGTDPLRACALNSSDNAWPSDMNNDTFSDVTDITALTGHFGQPVGPSPNAPARYDVAPDPPDGFVDITDITRLTALFGQTCTTIPTLTPTPSAASTPGAGIVFQSAATTTNSTALASLAIARPAGTATGDVLHGRAHGLGPDRGGHQRHKPEALRLLPCCWQRGAGQLQLDAFGRSDRQRRDRPLLRR